MASEWIEVGTDRVESVTGLQDADGNYLNSATISYSLKDASGTTVTGATGAYAYVTASDGNYQAVIDSAVTALLTPGRTYYLHVSVDQGTYEAAHVLARPTRLPASAKIVTAALYMEATNQTFTGGALAALRAACSAADAAVKARCRPNLLTPTTVTDAVLDAPPERVLLLPVTPVRSVTSVHFNWSARGDADEFDADDDLLTEFTDYRLVIDDFVNNVSRAGKLETLNRSAWAAEYTRRVGRLANTLGPIPGAVLCSWLAGPASVDENVFAAAVLFVGQWLARKSAGMPLTSESWNGYAHSFAGSYLDRGIVYSPDVTALLRDYLSVGVG